MGRCQSHQQICVGVTPAPYVRYELLADGCKGDPMSTTDRGIDADLRSEVVEGILDKLRTHYIFPETAQAMVQTLRQRLHRGAYDGITTAPALLDTLTAHLQELSHDKHLVLRYTPEPQPLSERVNLLDDPAVLEQMRRSALVGNFGFEKVERLRGNIGYIDLRYFSPAEWAGETMAAAMTLLVHTAGSVLTFSRMRLVPGGRLDRRS